MKLLASDIIFTKLSTKTFFFNAAVFHLSIKGYCKTRRIVFTAFCQCSSLVVNGITEVQKSSNIYVAGVQHDVNTSRKRRRRDADIRSAATAAAARRRRRRTALVWLCFSATYYITW